MKFKFDINRYTWLGYPLFVIMFVVTCTNVLLSSQEQVREVFSKKSQVESVEEQVEKLEDKLEALRALDQQALTQDLDLMTAAVPAARQVWSMISGIRQAASESSVILDSYRVSVGDVREATSAARTAKKDDHGLDIRSSFEVNDLTSLATLSEQLNGLLPLLRVVSIKFASNKADLVIEGAWNPRKGVLNDVREPLPVFLQNVESVMPFLVDRVAAPDLSSVKNEGVVFVGGAKLF
ncbi:MAG: hypothetical protein AAB909_02120 [Patescibacteria group bacterium]